jgi:hypothetical protein
MNLPLPPGFAPNLGAATVRWNPPVALARYGGRHPRWRAGLAQGAQISLYSYTSYPLVNVRANQVPDIVQNLMRIHTNAEVVLQPAHFVWRWTCVVRVVMANGVIFTIPENFWFGYPFLHNNRNRFSRRIEDLIRTQLEEEGYGDETTYDDPNSFVTNLQVMVFSTAHNPNVGGGQQVQQVQQAQPRRNPINNLFGACFPVVYEAGKNKRKHPHRFWFHPYSECSNVFQVHNLESANGHCGLQCLVHYAKMFRQRKRELYAMQLGPECMTSIGELDRLAVNKFSAYRVSMGMSVDGGLHVNEVVELARQNHLNLTIVNEHMKVVASTPDPMVQWGNCLVLFYEGHFFLVHTVSQVVWQCAKCCEIRRVLDDEASKKNSPGAEMDHTRSQSILHFNALFKSFLDNVRKHKCRAMCMNCGMRMRPDHVCPVEKIQESVEEQERIAKKRRLEFYQEQKSQDVDVPLVAQPNVSGPRYLDSDAQEILLKIQNRCNILIHGPGGTGKTYLINRLSQEMRQMYPNQHWYVCSTTGVSALNYENASTLHSLFGVGVFDNTPNDLAVMMRKARPGSNLNRSYLQIQEMHGVFIDEISMLSGMFLVELI